MPYKCGGASDLLNGATCLLNVGRVILGRVFFGMSCLGASCLWGELSVIPVGAIIESDKLSGASCPVSKTIYTACVHGSTNGTNGRPISFKVLPMVPLVIPLVPMVPLVKTDGSQYCRQSTVWAKLPTLKVT